eukprot:3858472-Pyramimonas_sp.AAC.1
MASSMSANAACALDAEYLIGVPLSKAMGHLCFCEMAMASLPLNDGKHCGSNPFGAASARPPSTKLYKQCFAMRMLVSCWKRPAM